MVQIQYAVQRGKFYSHEYRKVPTLNHGIWAIYFGVLAQLVLEQNPVKIEVKSSSLLHPALCSYDVVVTYLSSKQNSPARIRLAALFYKDFIMADLNYIRRMKKYLEEKKKLAKENPEEAKRQSIETLKKMGLIK